ncbi:Reticulocyte-binding protein 2-like a [Porphyridium purpureum]|uniref:Reticulocyte-binding protein 2-like a n=1 Tax=Porphyridium purpureum TaxID=35688 RepID=A0A5J4Z710_PORPP|nr:Reticulocyte-binding protein 2-like a [Porphyridium purpureum]|eukprot:POR9070..scf295_1
MEIYRDSDVPEAHASVRPARLLAPPRVLGERDMNVGALDLLVHKHMDSKAQRDARASELQLQLRGTVEKRAEANLSAVGRNNETHAGIVATGKTHGGSSAVCEAEQNHAHTAVTQQDSTRQGSARPGEDTARAVSTSVLSDPFANGLAAVPSQRLLRRANQLESALTGGSRANAAPLTPHSTSTDTKSHIAVKDNPWTLSAKPSSTRSASRDAAIGSDQSTNKVIAKSNAWTCEVSDLLDNLDAHLPASLAERVSRLGAINTPQSEPAGLRSSNKQRHVYSESTEYGRNGVQSDRGSVSRPEAAIDAADGKAPSRASVLQSSRGSTGGSEATAFGVKKESPEDHDHAFKTPKRRLGEAFESASMQVNGTNDTESHIPRLDQTDLPEDVRSALEQLCSAESNANWLTMSQCFQTLTDHARKEVQNENTSTKLSFSFSLKALEKMLVAIATHLTASSRPSLRRNACELLEVCLIRAQAVGVNCHELADPACSQVACALYKVLCAGSRIVHEVAALALAAAVQWTDLRSLAAFDRQELEVLRRSCEGVMDSPTLEDLPRSRILSLQQSVEKQMALHDVAPAKVMNEMKAESDHGTATTELATTSISPAEQSAVDAAAPEPVKLVVAREQETIEDLQARNSFLINRLEEFKATLENLWHNNPYSRERDELLARLNERESENAQLKAEMFGYDSKYKSLYKRYQEQTQLAEQRHAARDEAAASRRELREASKQLIEWRQQKHTEIEKYKVLLKQSTERSEQAQRSALAEQDQSKALRNERDELAARVEQLHQVEKVCEDLREQVRVLEQKSSQEQPKLEQLGRQLEERKGEVDSLMKQNQMLKARTEELERNTIERKRLADENQRLKASAYDSAKRIEDLETNLNYERHANLKLEKLVETANERSNYLQDLLDQLQSRV